MAIKLSKLPNSQLLKDKEKPVDRVNRLMKKKFEDTRKKKGYKGK
jgi:hypothetical protein